MVGTGNAYVVDKVVGRKVAVDGTVVESVVEPTGESGDAIAETKGVEVEVEVGDIVVDMDMKVVDIEAVVESENGELPKEEIDSAVADLRPLGSNGLHLPHRPLPGVVGRVPKMLSSADSEVARSKIASGFRVWAFVQERCAFQIIPDVAEQHFPW